MDELVVGAISVIQRVNVLENLGNIFDVFCGADPELFTWVLETFGFDFFHLVNSEVALFSPLKLLIQKVKHREVK